MAFFFSGIFSAAGAGMMLASLGVQTKNITLVRVQDLSALAIIKDR